MCEGIVGFDPQSLGVVKNRSVQFSLASEGVGQIYVGVRVVGIDSQSLGKMCNRVINLALIEKGSAEVALSIRVVRIEAHRFSVLSNGLVFPPFKVQSNSKMIARDVIIISH